MFHITRGNSFGSRQEFPFNGIQRESSLETMDFFWVDNENSWIEGFGQDVLHGFEYLRSFLDLFLELEIQSSKELPGLRCFLHLRSAPRTSNMDHKSLNSSSTTNQELWSRILVDQDHSLQTTQKNFKFEYGFPVHAKIQ